MADNQNAEPRLNTVAMLGQAYSLLGFQIVDGVVGAGYPQNASDFLFRRMSPEEQERVSMELRPRGEAFKALAAPGRPPGRREGIGRRPGPIVARR